MPSYMGNHPCYCGNKGCFVAETSEQAIVSKLHYGMQFTNNQNTQQQSIQNNNGEITIDTFIESVLNHDTEVMELFHEICELYSVIIVQIANYYNPKCVYICGRICDIGKPFLSKLNELLEGRFRKPANPPEIILMQNHIDGGHAAACMAMENVCSVINYIV